MDHTPSDLLYIGGYTGPGGIAPGISIARRQPDGRLDIVGRVTSPDASFLAVHPSLPLLYAVNEQELGMITTFAVAPDGGLTQVGVHSSHGSAPCHLAVNPAGTLLSVANYITGTVAHYPLDRTGLPQAPGRRVDLGGEAPHAHMVLHTADDVTCVVDLGGDRIHRQAPSSEDALSPLVLRPGSGPRHAVGDGQGNWYVTGELDASVTHLRERPDGGWQETTSLSASSSTGLNHPSHLALSADRRFLYVANRGPDSLTVLRLEDGVPSVVAEVPAEGSWPRHFALVDDFLYVANQHSSAVACLRIDPDTGVPEPTGHVLETPQPACVLAL